MKYLTLGFLIISIVNSANANPVNIPIGEGGTQIDAGATNTGETGQRWGVSNSVTRDGLLYFTYSNLAGTTLPSTIQPGTYTFSARIGSSTLTFPGLNNLSSGTNTSVGCVAGFFTSLVSDAEAVKNTMVSAFNNQTGVTYVQPNENDPAASSYTTWTFTWFIEPGSPTVGTDPYFGVYTKIGTSGGAGLWDDSSLAYSADGINVPVINDFTASKTLIHTGESVVLSWDVSNAETVTLSGIGDVTALTEANVSPTETTTYTLSISSEGITRESEVTIKIKPTKPNIIVFLVDDWGVMDTSEPFSYDNYTDGAQPVIRGFNNFYITPNLEQLADDGIKFTQAYALPVCSPTRTSLMTGFNAPRHGVTVHINLGGTYERPSGSNVATHRSPNNWRFQGMEVTDVTLPRLLSEQGYRSIHVGKGHFGARSATTADPIEIGFDVNLGGSGAGSPGNYVGNPDYSSTNNQVPNITDYHESGKWLTEALTEAANDAMQATVDDSEPFFTYMAYYAVHSPFTANPNSTNSYAGSVSTNHNRFATMVEGVDTSLGQIRAKLEEMGVAEDTLLIFTGDNGSDSPALTNRGFISNNNFNDYPIRGKKANCYEGGYHVPMFVAWAKHDPSNVFQQQLPIIPDSVEHDIVSLVDFAPTILSIADIDHPFMDGVDLSPYLTSTPGTHREQTLLIHQPNSQNSSFFTTYRRNDLKLIYFYYEDPEDAFELYDLSTDRDESDNLASANPQLVIELAREMAASLDKGWGDLGPLWPTLNGGGDNDRPFIDDTYLIDYTIEGRDVIDSDLDGIADFSEDTNADGLVNTGETDPDSADTDQDGTEDYAEIVLGLDPLNNNEKFEVSITSDSSTTKKLSWPSQPGLTFNIRASTTLNQTIENWAILHEDVLADSIQSSTEIYVDSSTDDKKFFAIELK
ncbi:MAG: sulfatase-like hydrolase/transferase [Akkermansiaceae bacterium]